MFIIWGLPGGTSGKEPTCHRKRQGFNSWVGKIPWRRKWQPTLVFLPGKFHGHWRLLGCSPWGHQELDMGEQLSTHFHYLSNKYNLPRASIFLFSLLIFLSYKPMKNSFHFCRCFAGKYWIDEWKNLPCHCLLQPQNILLIFNECLFYTILLQSTICLAWENSKATWQIFSCIFKLLP